MTHVRDLRGVIEREKSSNRGSYNAEYTNVRNEKEAVSAVFIFFMDFMKTDIKKSKY